MIAHSIDAAALSPQFNLPKVDQLKPNLHSRLLGQERTLDAFNLLAKACGQHMYLADQSGIDRLALI